MKIGIIGAGFVGSATASVWKPHFDVLIHDKVPEKSTHRFSETARCDIVFICLPTPMSKDGSCDTSALDECFDSLAKLKANLLEGEVIPLYVIRSTIPVGYTRWVANQFNLNVCHNPEALTARTAHMDAHTPARILIGSERGICVDLFNIYRNRFPGCQVIHTHSKVTEAAKLACNSFFAVKISFFNELRAWALQLDIDWDDLLAAILSDGRIAYSHTEVPGPDGKLAYGGTCLPKDIHNLLHLMKADDVRCGVIKAAAEWGRVNE